MTRPLKVLEVLGQSAGGVGRHVARVVESLADDPRFEIDVAAPPGLKVPMPKPVLPVPIPAGAVFGHARAIGILRSLIARGRYEVVHAHGLRAGIDTGLAAQRGSARVVYTAHNVVRPEIAGAFKARLYARSEPWPVALSDRTLAASDEIARHLKDRGADPAKIETVYLGVGEPPSIRRSRSDIERELDSASGRKLIVTVARLASQKALHVLLGALQRLDQDTILLLIGDGPLEEELRSLAFRLGISQRVHFLGYRHDVWDFVAAADVFCLSSVWEAVALAAQEAVLLGTPVVATDVGGMSELFEDRVSGRLVAPGDPVALAEALREVLSSEGARRLYAQAARKTLRERFSTDAMLARLTALYTELGDAA